MRCLKLSSELLQELLRELSARLAPMPENTATCKLTRTPSTDNKVAHQRRHSPPCIPAHELLRVAPDPDGKAMRARNNQYCKGRTGEVDSPQFTISALRLRDCDSRLAAVCG